MIGSADHPARGGTCFAVANPANTVPPAGEQARNLSFGAGLTAMADC